MGGRKYTHDQDYRGVRDARSRRLDRNNLPNTRHDERRAGLSVEAQRRRRADAAAP